MPRHRILTPTKKLLLNAVIANPGFSVGKLAKLTGVPVWKAQKALFDLTGRKLIHYRIESGDKLRTKRWYPLVATQLSSIVNSPN